MKCFVQALTKLDGNSCHAPTHKVTIEAVNLIIELANLNFYMEREIKKSHSFNHNSGKEQKFGAKQTAIIFAAAFGVSFELLGPEVPHFSIWWLSPRCCRCASTCARTPPLLQGQSCLWARQVAQMLHKNRRRLRNLNGGGDHSVSPVLPVRGCSDHFSSSCCWDVEEWRASISTCLFETLGSIAATEPQLKCNIYKRSAVVNSLIPNQLLSAIHF